MTIVLGTNTGRAKIENEAASVGHFSPIHPDWRSEACKLNGKLILLDTGQKWMANGYLKPQLAGIRRESGCILIFSGPIDSSTESVCLTMETIGECDALQRDKLKCCKFN